MSVTLPRALRGACPRSAGLAYWGGSAGSRAIARKGGGVMSLFGDFKKFVLRGNLVDMAIGFTVGAAFTTIAHSLVGDIIMPPLGLVLGSSDFSNFFVVLKEGVHAGPYATLAAAKAAGAVTLNYGVFINSLVAFLIVALAMFAIMRLVNRVDEALEGAPPPAGEPTNKKCPHCLETIAYRATRCSHCTSELAPLAQQVT